MSSEIKPRAVYKLVRTDKPEDGTDVYVGSTSLSLKTRLNLHRYHAKVCNSKLYTRMSGVGVDNWKIVPLLTFTCDQKTIREFERQWAEIFNTDLNVFLPYGSTNKRVNNWNNGIGKEIKKKHILNSIEEKRHYCELCDKVFESNRNLQRHQKSSKHFWKYIYSVD